MALISCPECGKQVSSNAKLCPNCGCPIISNNGSVAIKTPRFGGPFFSQNVQIINEENSQVLWAGRQGEVARFVVSKPTKIIIKFGKSAMTSSVKSIKAIVHANKKYTCTQDRGMHFFATFHLTEVDFIDS